MVIDLIFPKKCLGCGRGTNYICATCHKKVPKGRWHNGIYCLWRHQGVVRKAILKLKYSYVTDLAQELADLAAKGLVTSGLREEKYILVPVPLHKARLRQRGFNQAELVGEKIAAKMGWKFVPDLVIRTKKTKPQMELPRYQRLVNIVDAFKVREGKKVGSQNFIIFDDVSTTGSTIGEIRKVLWAAGAEKVVGLTLCS